MTAYRVRDHFWLHGVGNDPIGPGVVVDLDDAQAERYAHQIEPVAEEAPKRAVKGRAGAGR